MSERIRSNVRERRRLEGGYCQCRFTGSRITVDQVKRTLRDLFAIQGRQVSIENIQKVVAEYFNIKISDLLSKEEIDR